MKKLTSILAAFILCLSIIFLGSCAASNATSAYLRGVGDPTEEMGNDGDMYLNTKYGSLYNKAGGVWIKVGNLTGQIGKPGETGQDGVTVTKATVLNNKLVFTLSNGEQIETSLSGKDTTYDVSINDGIVAISTNRVFENKDSIAFGNKSFRDIFEKGNILTTGNLLDNTQFGSWDTTSGSKVLSTTEYSSVPSSLDVSGSKNIENVKSLKSSDKGILYLAAGCRIIDYTSGKAGIFSRIGGNDYTDGMIKKATIGFEISSQVVNALDSAIQIVLGTTDNAQMTAFIDSAVVVNLSNVFGGSELPTKEELDDLLQVYVKMFNGETNVNLNKRYTSERKEDVIPKDVAKDKFFDLIYTKAQQIGLTLKREDITSAIGLNNGEITLEDLCKIGIHATGYEVLSKIWNETDYITTTQGNVRTFHVMNVNHHHDYFNEFADYYHMLGGKPGALNHKGEPPVRTMIVVAEGPNEETFVLATSGHYVDQPGSNRMSNCKVVMDIACRLYNDPTANVEDLEANFSPELDGAVCVKLPKSGHIFNYARYDWFGASSKYCLYNFNGTMPIKTASAWKTMTAITSLDHMSDLDTRWLVRLDDLPRPSLINDPKLEGGEIITYRDALYFMMLPSSNIAPNVIARNVGEMMIRKGL